MADVDSTGSTSSPQEDTSQAPAPESATTPTEAEPTQSEPVEASKPETQTAQVPVNEPFDDTHDKPIAPAPEPPATATNAPVTPVPTHASRDLLVKARATIQDRKHKKLEKILEFLNTKGKITNDEVEKLLHVSDATATRYLSSLEQEGKIKQVGKTGTGVEYTKV